MYAVGGFVAFASVVIVLPLYYRPSGRRQPTGKSAVRHSLVNDPLYLS